VIFRWRFLFKTGNAFEALKSQPEAVKVGIIAFYRKRQAMWLLILLSLLKLNAICATESIIVGTNVLKEPFVQQVACRAFGQGDEHDPQSRCWPSNNCRRKIVDGLFSKEDVEGLVKIANKGIVLRPRHGGPTIVDINTGYIRDTTGLENMFARSGDIFDSDDFLHYGNCIRKLKQEVMKTFDLDTLYFTAPTFITRIDAGVEWSPQGMHGFDSTIVIWANLLSTGIHDEYWHTHSDRNNTAHYQYSGLLYLSTHNVDFTGGTFLLMFIDNGCSN